LESLGFSLQTGDYFLEFFLFLKKIFQLVSSLSPDLGRMIPRSKIWVVKYLPFYSENWLMAYETKQLEMLPRLPLR
jgi:hypothetical protein